METDNYIFFYGHKPNKWGTNVFSQWFPVKFTEKWDSETKLVFNNTEQYMMAHKALLFGDAIIFLEIMDTSSPFTIKKLGRNIKKFDPKIWNDHKFNIVVEGNRLKFNQNPELMDVLLKTGNKTIVEASPYDKIWGIGITAEKAINIPENKWPGQNLLGHALMVVRSEYNS